VYNVSSSRRRYYMKTVGIDTKVVSSHGDIITYKEHCQRLATYLEEIKEKALLLTQRNPELTQYIRSLELFFGEELLIEDKTCFYFVSIGSRYYMDELFPTDESAEWTYSTVIDENGYPKLDYDFLIFTERLCERLVTDFIMPHLVNNMDFFVSFVKKAILIEMLKWNYISDERRGACYELLFQHIEPDRFWLVVTSKVRVLIGEFKDIERELVRSPERYMNSSLLIVDMDKKRQLKAQQVYSDLFERFSYRGADVWGYGTFVPSFALRFREFITVIDPILNIGIDNAYKLAELLRNTEGEQDKLIRGLRTMPTGDGKAYEKLVKNILEFLFNDEFTPFKVKDQIETDNKKRIRDFIIDNRNPRSEFWRNLKILRGVEQILFDTKNYKDPIKYAKITSTLRYLRNKAFGNFIIIISRYGVKDYVETLEDYTENGRVILYLSDVDLIAMINLKTEGKAQRLYLKKNIMIFLIRYKVKGRTGF
jgi:hypothetical protein